MIVDKMEVRILGQTPLLIANGQTADPTNYHSKKLKSLTSKRNKTEEDLENILETQWEAGLYWNDEIGLYMPSENLYAGFLKAARKHKIGNKCSAISFSESLGYPILTEGHKDFVSLKSNPKNKFKKIVVIQRSKTVSCRPIFHNWKINFDIEFEREVIDSNEIKTVLMTWRSRVGMGVWTPGSPKPGSYGKFIIESLTLHDGKTNEKKSIKGLE